MISDKRSMAILVAFIGAMALLFFFNYENEDFSFDSPRTQAQSEHKVQGARRQVPSRLEHVTASSALLQEISNIDERSRESEEQGSVLIATRDERQEPVAEVHIGIYEPVEISSDKWKRVATVVTDDLGNYTLSISPGLYFAKIEQAPKGYLANNQLFDIPRLMFSAKVGAESHLEVTLNKAAEVYGRVIDGQTYEPIEGAVVRAQPTSGDFRRGAEAVTDSNGEYRIQPVPPGSSRVLVFLGAAKGKWSKLPQPLPVDIELKSSEVRALPDFYVGDAHQQLRGRVLTELGEPFAGIPVLCYLGEEAPEGVRGYTWLSSLGSTKTDENGYYVLEKLPAVKVKVHVGDYEPGTALGKRKAAWWVEQPLVDLRQTSVVPDIMLPKSKPAMVSGKLILPNKKRLGDMKLQVQLLNPADEVQQDKPWLRLQAGAKSRKVKLRRDGTFSWSCETPHPEVLFVLTDRKTGLEQSRRLVLDTEGSQEMSFNVVD